MKKNKEGYVRIVGDTRDGFNVEVHEKNAFSVATVLANIIKITRETLIDGGVPETVVRGLLYVAYDLALWGDNGDDDDECD